MNKVMDLMDPEELDYIIKELQEALADMCPEDKKLFVQRLIDVIGSDNE